MQLDGPILLYGAGREATSTRAFLAKKVPNTKVFVTADSGEAKIDNTTFIPPDELEAAITAKKFALIIKSPGVSLYKPIFKIAKKAAIPTTSNLNLWNANYRVGRKVVAITGTKGKSTTATLVHLMLRESGCDAGLAGNVGVPPLDIANNHETIIFELSSYQTADMDFAADIVGLTNLYPEHLDWHGSTKQYYKDKLKLIDRDGDFHVAMSVQAHSIKQARRAIHHDTRRIMVLQPLIDDAVSNAVAKSALKGAHNLDNARLATRLALAAGATLDGVLAGIVKFKPLPHRLEEHQIGDLSFVDDSISTTPQATMAALEAYKGRKIALIAGGFDREQQYDELATVLEKSGVIRLICLPDTGKRLADSAEKAFPKLRIAEVRDIAEAIRTLSIEPIDFDTVIMSPGAPSYNQFKDFAQRGDVFMSEVKICFTR